MDSELKRLNEAVKVAQRNLQKELLQVTRKAFIGKWTLRYSISTGYGRQICIRAPLQKLRKNPSFVVLEDYLKEAHPYTVTSGVSVRLPYGISLNFYEDTVLLHFTKPKLTLSKIGVTLSKAGYSHLTGKQYYGKGD